MWDEWCMLVGAEPLPGALEFTQRAAVLGVEVFYISNREIHFLDVTLKNLRDVGFPYVRRMGEAFPGGDPGGNNSA